MLCTSIKYTQTPVKNHLARSFGFQKTVYYFLSIFREDQKSHLHFNLESFRVATSGNTTLTNRVKYILMKDSEDRKPEEIEMLFNLVNQMKVTKVGVSSEWQGE